MPLALIESNMGGYESTDNMKHMFPVKNQMLLI